MGWPDYQQITVEVIKRLQTAMGDDAEVHGAGGTTVIEVVDGTGWPVRESYAKPQLSVIGPTVATATDTPQGQRGQRAFVSKDTDELTYIDAPAPRRVNLTYNILGYFVRESSITGGPKGLLWTMTRVEDFVKRRIGSVRIWDAEWEADLDGWTGYEFGGTTPSKIPGSRDGLHSFSAALTVYRVCRAEDDRGAGLLTMEGGAELDGPYVDEDL